MNSIEIALALKELAEKIIKTNLPEGYESQCDSTKAKMDGTYGEKFRIKNIEAYCDSKLKRFDEQLDSKEIQFNRARENAIKAFLKIPKPKKKAKNNKTKRKTK